MEFSPNSPYTEDQKSDDAEESEGDEYEVEQLVTRKHDAAVLRRLADGDGVAPETGDHVEAEDADDEDPAADGKPVADADAATLPVTDLPA